MKPFSPETLAERWGCSAATVRNKCAAGELPHFRLGKLYRIPLHVVEGIEQCQTLPLEGSEGASAPSGTRTGSADGISLRHAPERKRRQKQ